MTEKIDDARRTLHGLEEKLAAARIAKAKFAEESRAISFDAHTAGGPAKKRLDELNAKGVQTELEIQSLTVAISEARSRVDDAVADEAEAAARENAALALQFLDDYSQLGGKIGDAAYRLFELLAEANAGYETLDAWGCAPATRASFEVNLKLAIQSRLQGSVLQLEGFLAPFERREFAALFESWTRSARAKASAKLNKIAPSKAA